MNMTAPWFGYFNSISAVKQDPDTPGLDPRKTLFQVKSSP